MQNFDIEAFSFGFATYLSFFVIGWVGRYILRLLSPRFNSEIHRDF